MTKKQPVFYGWWIVLGLFAIDAVASLGRYNLAAFLPFIMDEMGWGRETISLAQSIAIWLYALSVVLSGVLVDRIGSRKTFLMGGAITILGWALFSIVQAPWQLYLCYGVLLALAVGMTHYVPVMATIRKWFVKRAGVVAGVTGSAWALGNAIFMPVMTGMAASQGWRHTSLVLGICFGALIILCALFVVRDTPESVGLRPDGEISAPSVDPAASIEISWDVKRALKTSQFLLLFLTYSVYNIGLNGLAAHGVTWGTELGCPEATAGIFSTAFAVPWIVGCVAGGWLGDRYGKTNVMPVGLIIATAAMLYGGLGVHSQQGLMALSIGVGFGTGLQVPLYAALLGDLFGRARVGSLFGILTFGYGLIGGWGPLIWATLREATGSYNDAALLSTVCYAMAAVALLLVRPMKVRGGT
ncbi:MAG: MFS transporter [Dehalococcoidia bacterium]|nr:MFS transporter [Dehalococcoidia bacterium]MDH4367688.1 MFS transporter [Dehalococcoidia bacterium]